MKLHLATSLALASLLAGTAAQAAPASESERETVTVHVGDLNLNTAAGADHALNRLRAAAQSVCGEDADSRLELYRMNQIRTCEQEAIGPAVQRLNSPSLAALYERQFHLRSASVSVGPVPG